MVTLAIAASAEWWKEAVCRGLSREPEVEKWRQPPFSRSLLTKNEGTRGTVAKGNLEQRKGEQGISKSGS